MRNLIPSDSRQTEHDIFIPKSLNNCKNVFVRVDRIKTGHTSPYEGPYKVIRRMRKYFVLDIKNKNLTISIDRLKPAYSILCSAQNELGSSANQKIKNLKFRTEGARLGKCDVVVNT